MGMKYLPHRDNRMEVGGGSYTGDSPIKDPYANYMEVQAPGRPVNPVGITTSATGTYMVPKKRNTKSYKSELKVMEKSRDKWRKWFFMLLCGAVMNELARWIVPKLSGAVLGGIMLVIFVLAYVWELHRMYQEVKK